MREKASVIDPLIGVELIEFVERVSCGMQLRTIVHTHSFYVHIYICVCVTLHTLHTGAFAQKIAKAYPGSFLFMQCYMYKAAKAWGSDGRDDEIVMVLEHGGPTTIREAMEAEAVTDDDAVMIMHQLITALGKLRALHLTHHDLKIGNIMFAKEVNEQGKDVVHIKLVDYGAMYDYNLGTRKKLVTTRSFAPPEYLQSKITDRWRYGFRSFPLCLPGSFMPTLDLPCCRLSK